MNRAWLVLVAIFAGCYNHCDYAPDGCPSSSELSSLDSRLCDPDVDSQCSSSSLSCVCDSRTRRWRCDSVRSDLAVTSRDLSTPPVGCADYVGCLVHCFQTTLNPSVATCEASCAPSVSGDAVLRYTAAVDCAESYCAGAGDGGGGACLRAVDGSLLNADGSARSPTDSGTGQKRCNLCLHDAMARLHGEACTQESNPDCNPPACVPAVDECLND